MAKPREASVNFARLDFAPCRGNRDCSNTLREPFVYCVYPDYHEKKSHRAQTVKNPVKFAMASQAAPAPHTRPQGACRHEHEHRIAHNGNWVPFFLTHPAGAVDSWAVPDGDAPGVHTRVW